MLEQFFNSDGNLIYHALMAICAVAVVFSFGLPLLERNQLKSRMKSVALEREKIRSESRKMMDKEGRNGLRSEARPFIKDMVEKLKLEDYFGFDDMQQKLKQAGYRGEAPLATFLFFRLVVPIIVFLFTLFYLFVVLRLDQSAMLKLAIAGFAMYFGYQLP